MAQPSEQACNAGSALRRRHIASPAIPRPHERESFAGQDLRQVNLDGHYSKMCNLTAVDLRGASLRGAWFAFCDLRGADLRGADLTDATFTRVLTDDPAGGRTDVTGARFGSATM